MRRLSACAVLVVALVVPAAAWASWVPNDPRYVSGSESWLRTIGWLPSLAAPSVGPFPTIAIADSGIAVSDQDFAGYVGPESADCVDRTNGRAAESASYVDDRTGERHGTNVAKLAAAPAQGLGMVGVSPNSQLLDVRITRSELDVSTRSVACALRWIDRTAAREQVVVNLSFSISQLGSAGSAALTSLIRHGALVVAAAGNRTDAGNVGITKPARLPHVLAVGDSEERQSLAGPELDVLAPGAFGSPNFNPSIAGTSFAAPLVTGAAAVVWAAHPDVDNAQVIAYLLRRTASNWPHHGNQTGFGTINVAWAAHLRVPRDDEYEPNDGARQAFSTMTRWRNCNPHCTVYGIAGTTDDPVDWWPITAPSCRALKRIKVASIEGKVSSRTSCAALGHGRVAVAVRPLTPSARYRLEIRRR